MTRFRSIPSRHGLLVTAVCAVLSAITAPPALGAGMPAPHLAIESKAMPTYLQRPRGEIQELKVEHPTGGSLNSA